MGRVGLQPGCVRLQPPARGVAARRGAAVQLAEHLEARGVIHPQHLDALARLVAQGLGLGLGGRVGVGVGVGVGVKVYGSELGFGVSLRLGVRVRVRRWG